MVLEWLLLLERDGDVLENIYGAILLKNSKKRESLKKTGFCFTFRNICEGGLWVMSLCV